MTNTGSDPGITGELLWIFRHGKAAPGVGMADFDRPLADARATADAELINRWIDTSELPRPERFIASPALRTKQTAELLASPSQEETPIPITYIDALYMASARELLRVITEALLETPRLGVVGHNPSVSQVVALMAGGEWPEFTGLPTLGCAMFAFSGTEDRLVLHAHATPKSLR